MVKKQAKKRRGGQYVVNTVLYMRSKKMSAAQAKAMKNQIKRKAPKARVTVTKA